MRNFSLAAALAASTCILAIATPTQAQAQQIAFNIPAGGLKEALDAYGHQAGRPIVYKTDEVRGVRSPGYRGNASAEQALGAILTNTGFSARAGASGSVAIVRVGNGPVAAGTAALLGADQTANGNVETQQIVVTGTRIRGAPSISPVITVTQRQARDAGQNDLGELFRSIPQNFTGGLNPGLASGAGATNPNNGDVTGGSAIDLRGLGPDATLTLLNGHRLAYESTLQAIDVSAIPLAAVDRVEVIPDGASALYGSDAVAGVANIILKRDYDGVSMTGRLGGATEGGDVQQQYSLVAGQKWENGGYIGTFNYEHSSPIYASQRSYTDYMLEPNTLIGGQRSVGGVASIHQRLFDNLTFSVDGLFNRRNSDVYSTSNLTSTAIAYRRTRNYDISPALVLALPSGWTVTGFGVFGSDKTDTDSGVYNRAGAATSRLITCYCNKIANGEINGEGPLLRLPAGDVRLAVGGGYRDTIFDSISKTSPSSNVEASRQSYYGFGEILVPLIAPSQNVGLAYRLLLSGALRYEHYSDFGRIATPRMGIVYSPTRDIDIKGSWSRSFKTPALLQEYLKSTALLINASVVGATGVPPTATALYLTGGDIALQPERAVTWDATAGYHPSWAPGLKLEVSYFKVRYSNRIILPVAVTGAALTNPAYRQFIQLGPSAADLSAAISAATAGFLNAAGRAYDPTSVVALIDNRYTNAASQKVHGVDLSGDYSFDLNGLLTISGRASWLSDTQKNSNLAPEFDLAGTVYNPPHWRARVGASWETGPLTLSTYVNYLGPVLNTQVTPNVPGNAMTTFDVAMIYRPGPRSGPLAGVEVAASVMNVADTHPPFTQNSNTTRVNYDSTNYSPVGRFVDLSITKSF